MILIVTTLLAISPLWFLLLMMMMLSLLFLFFFTTLFALPIFFDDQVCWVRQTEKLATLVLHKLIAQLDLRVARGRLDERVGDRARERLMRLPGHSQFHDSLNKLFIWLWLW